MSLGRISGPLLKANLLREGVDLAFETDLLYLDVNTLRIGIKSDAPAYELDVNGTVRSTTLRGGRLVVDDVVVNDNLVSTEVGDLKLGAATLSNNVVATTNFLPDLTDTYNLGSSLKRWNQGFFNSLTVDGIEISTGSGSVPLITDEIDKVYVQLNGSDTAGNGENIASAYRTVKYALSQATSGQTIAISPGVYEEVFPLTVPQGVSLLGAGLRSTTIKPTLATQNKDCFLLNGETTVQDLTVKDMFYDTVNNTGYAFRFAPGCVVAQRSPYVQRITVLNKGSAPTANDPYGFSSGDAGRGALLDGAVVSRNSLEAAILFNECTFIVPNSRSLVMTNGARTEWLNCFTYFADLAIEGVVGISGRGGDGKTYLELANVTGTFNAGDTISYYDADGITVIAASVIESISGNRIALDGSVSGFNTNSNRLNKTVVANNGAQLSTVQKKFGVSSISLDGTDDYVFTQSTLDFNFSTSDFTFEGWFYRSVGSVQVTLFDFRTTATQNAPWLFITSGGTLAYHVNGTTRITGAGGITVGNWHHVAVSRNIGNTKIFVNGTQVGSTWADTTNYVQSPLTIGAKYTGTLEFFNGYIDEVRVTKGLARYTGNFTAPTVAFNGDNYSVLLSHFDGVNGSTTITDDGVTYQDIRSTSGGTATAIVRYDRAEFAAEMRSISGANVYGNAGVRADGPDVVLQLMAHNFAYIGTGFDLTNNKAGVVQANEVIELNNGRVYYNSVDQEGNYRVGDLFVVDFATGAVTFQNASFDVTTLTGITFTDGTNTTKVNPQGIETGNIVIAGNTISSVSGQIILDPSGTQLLFVNSPLEVVNNATFNADVAVNGGNLTTTQTTFNLLNTTATTVNFAGAATDIQIGAATGTTNINNNLDVDGDVNIDGGDLTVSTTTFNLANTTATTGNLFGAATTINIGAAGSTGTLTVKNDNVVLDGDLQVKGGDLTTNQTTFNLLNTIAETVNFAGAATDIQIGAATGTTNINNNLDVDGDINIDGGDLTVSTAIFNLANTNANTINAFGAGEIISVGANTSTVTLNNDLTVKRNVSIEGTNLTTTQTSFNLLDGTATTIQAFGAAETLVFASSTGTTTFRSDVVINKDLQVKGGDITTNSSSFNLVNDTATTVNFAGAATVLNLGILGGTTTVKGDLQVDGNAEITGDLTISGNLVLGNQDTDTITVTADFTSNLVPDVASTYDLGAVGKEWANLYANTATVTTLSNGTITLTGNTIEIVTLDTDLVLEPNGTGRVVLNTTTAITIPVGTVAQRPTPATVGDVRFNTDAARVENYNGEQWNTMTNEDDAIAFAIALG
jgi:hypothetical protein